MITHTQQIVCSIVSRQLIADQSPTSCRPIATYFQSVGNQSPTSRRPTSDWSPIFRDSCRRPVADWSATEKRSFWSHSGCIGCSCFLVARQSPTGCSACVTGALLNRLFRRRSKKTSKLRVTCLCAGNSPGSVNSPHKGPVTWKMFPFDDVIMIGLIPREEHHMAFLMEFLQTKLP